MSFLSTISPNLTHECVLELLKLSSNVNEFKPLARPSRYGSLWHTTHFEISFLELNDIL